MHFHLPKPLHGWREFAGEVAIIVLGVLIALGAEQVVEDWQWHQKVEVVRRSLMGELGNDRARWERDVSAGRCALADVDRLDTWAENGASGAARPVPALRSGNFLTMHTANWSLATGSETLDHFPVSEQLAFAALYNGLENRAPDLANVSDSIDRVHTLIPLTANPQALLELREKLGDVRGSIANLIDNVPYMTRHFDALGVKPDRSDFDSDFRSPVCPA